jgi:exodeoxyribonuclease V alpha subunit
MTQQVIIDEVLSVGPHGGAIFSASTDAGQRLRFVAVRVVMARPPVAGEVWEIGGTVRMHPKYGRQVYVAAARLKRPSGRVIVSVLAKSPAFAGIGMARARKLYEELGGELYDALDDGDVERIARVIGGELARVVVEGWSQLSADAKSYQWLDRQGLPSRLARKLADIYGTEVAEKLDENPYRLLAFLSWSKTDGIGRALGVPDDDERRLVAAAEATAYKRLADAHTWAPRVEMIDGARELLKCPQDVSKRAIDLAVAHHALIEVDDGLQPLGPHSMETFIAAECAALLKGERAAAQSALVPVPTLDEVAAILKCAKGRPGGIELTKDQLRAVHMIATEPLSVLAGGAGVGKTTTLKGAHAVARQQMRPVWQMALSGKAARRMSQATGEPATTIASFLNRIGIGQLDLATERWCLIIDEASMLDLPTLYRILRAMQPGNSLVLVGDPGQLPPIGFGLTFHVLAEENAIPRVELTEVHRQAASTGIPQAAALIREGRVPKFDAFAGPGVGVSFIEAEPKHAFHVIAHVLERLGGTDEAQIIGTIKAGPAGVTTLNRAFHAMLAKGHLDHGGFSVGEPVIWTVNDPELDLLNGTLGCVAEVGEELKVTWDDGHAHTIPEQRIGDMEHAYAITCHKAQGSQFRRVVVPVYSNRLLDRTMLYTAVTRAEEQVILVGDLVALQRSLAALSHESLRSTGIHYHLRARLAS